jgi:membrane-associated phospholipid phosphatase
MRRRWWPLLATYPLAMTFTLVYGGEHWLVDVLVGWVYVAGVLLLIRSAERWWYSTDALGEEQREPVPDSSGARTLSAGADRSDEVGLPAVVE